MEKDDVQAYGKPYLLNRTDEMDEKLYESGKMDVPVHVIATELGCNRNTLRSFFTREPEAREFYLKGKREARQIALQKGREAARAYHDQGSLRAQTGETCDYCCQPSHRPVAQTITITATELAKSQMKLERVLERSIMARHED